MNDQLDNAKRREFVKRAAYVTPLVLTLPVTPAFATHGSEKERRPTTGHEVPLKVPRE